MEWGTTIFYVFGAITLLSALFILFTRNILYAAFSLILTFVGVAGIFVLSGAEFIGVTQLLVYVGGILVLIVFGVMLTNRVKGQKVVSPVYQKFVGSIVGIGLFMLLMKGILEANFGAMQWMKTNEQQTSLKRFGMTLMTDYVVVFEVIGILLLVALIGAVYMAGKRKGVNDAS